MAPPGRGRRLALVAIAAGACGCNLLIDPDRYRGNAGDGGPGGDAAGNIDAGPDGGSPPDALLPDDSDAGPIEPAAVAEGQGAGTGGRPVVVVLRGDFEAGDVVRIGDPDLTVEPAVVATDGSMIAVAARFPVDPELAEGATQTYDVFVDEVLVDVITVNGLDEATLSGTVNGADLDPRYSSIEVTGNVTFTGTEPVRLVATADIDVGGDLDASGDEGGAAGPGGCGGGNAGSAGGCSIHGGGAGATAGTAGTGGGGGGHATVGGPGAGGGGGGQASGSDFLTPIDEEGGNGGGGGGAGTLGAGGAGGGGGGVASP